MATMSTTTNRRAVPAGIAAAPALAAPALALTAPDPIFAVIDRYKTAVAARWVALSACMGYGEPKPFPEDGPESAAAESVHDTARDREFELLDKLLATSPTTVAGMAALLQELGVDHYWEAEGNDPDVDREPLIVRALERSPDLMTTLASTPRSLCGAVS
jgi:hypothetical protein